MHLILEATWLKRHQTVLGGTRGEDTKGAMAVHGTDSKMYVTGPVPIHTVTVPRRVLAAAPRPLAPLASSWVSGPRQSATSPALPIHQGLPHAVQVRPAGVATKAPTSAASASSASGMLARGLCRQTTGDNLANYFTHGRRRFKEPPTVVERSPRSPGRRESGATSLCPKADTREFQPASPRGAVEVWGQAEVTASGLTRRPARLHHGPNPMQLQSEVGSKRRMSHGEPPHLQEAWQALRQTLSEASEASPCRSLHRPLRRAVSNDAAHRRSAGVKSCLDGSLSEGEDTLRFPARPSRRATQQQSVGAVRGMQMQVTSPEGLEENPSGEEAAEGFPKGRRGKEKRHISPKAGDGGGALAHGLKSAASANEDPLGLKRRGRRSQGAQEERCSRSPGPWEPLPGNTTKKDGWGRFTARPPPTLSRVGVRAPYGTESDLAPSSTVMRFHSAPPLPYGSETDVPLPSPRPRGGIPLGMSIPELPGDACTGGSGDNEAEVTVAEPDTGGTEVPELLLSARTWRPASPAERRKATPRASSADSHRIGKSLMSSTFVERQRLSSSLRGGSRRLSSGGNLAPQLNRKLSDQPRTTFHSRPSGQGRTRLWDVAKPNPQLDEAYNKCLQSISEEIEQLQSRCFRIEREVRKTREENGMLKASQPQSGQDDDPAG